MTTTILLRTGDQFTADIPAAVVVHLIADAERQAPDLYVFDTAGGQVEIRPCDVTRVEVDL